ncbi:MAG: hypothetical protein M1822_000012 [Bathelium mastoideum]|nr:MAG: hypothetical protein M1822_000012 [Bathelium mastoideum]
MPAGDHEARLSTGNSEATDRPTTSDESGNYEDSRFSDESTASDKILKEEEERERLIAATDSRRQELRSFQRSRSSLKSTSKKNESGKHERFRGNRSAGHFIKNSMLRRESGDTFELDRRDRWASSESSRTSSEADRERLGNLRARKPLRKSRMLKFTMIHTVIVFLFLALLFAAYKASRKGPSIDVAKLTLSNGTTIFAPTTILISLDGFRADFLQRGLTPTLNAFIQDGVSPQYMLPSFPSVTFPNHFTLVTGLYPESHGVVGNTFWDPWLKAEFYYTDPDRSMQPMWWKGEPLWVTAENQGVRSAIHMWPGSEARIANVDPTYVDVYNGDEKLSRKVERVLGLIDLPGPDSPKSSPTAPRPQLIAAYVPNVDADGHRYGPNSTEIRTTIRDVDDMLNGIFKGLEQRNLTNVVNVVVVSDHGMATTSNNRLLQFEDLVNPNLIEHIDGWPLYGLRPKHEAELKSIYHDLKKKAAEIDSIEVYLRDEDMPERYHFSNNDRIAPLWIIPKAGWAIVTREEYDLKEGIKHDQVYHPRGLHGYDHENPLMRAIFVARGPAFPHKPGSRIPVLQNTEIYNIVCDSLGITPVPNNGTLRLPLKPIGLHSDHGVTPPEIPNDLPASVASTRRPARVGPTLKPVSEFAAGTTNAAATIGKETIGNDHFDSDPWFSWTSAKLHSLKDWAWSRLHNP